MKRKPTADDVRKVALAALTSALADGKQEARAKPGLTGMRAVATGAVLYTAGRAAVGGSRFLRERLGDANGREEADTEEYDEPDAESDEDFEDEDEEPGAASEEDFEDDEEPEAESDEDFEDEEEPEAESEEDFEDDEEEPEAESEEDFEDEEEPEAESEEDFEDEEDEEKPRRRSASRRAPVRSKSGSREALPERPSRSRAPVGRS